MLLRVLRVQYATSHFFLFFLFSVLKEVSTLWEALSFWWPVFVCFEHGKKHLLPSDLKKIHVLLFNRKVSTCSLYLAHLDEVEINLCYIGVRVSVGIMVKVLEASPFPSNYKPYLDQTCMDDASRDGNYHTCFGCWIWPRFSRWVNFSHILIKLAWMMYLRMDTFRLVLDSESDLHFPHEWPG